ncbi:hypothetical protein [Microbacterium aurum]
MDGHAVPMADPPMDLTAHEARLLDACALVMPDVLGELGEATGEIVPGTDSCRTAYTGPDGRSISYDVWLGIGAEETLTTYEPLGTATGWMPVLGRPGTGPLCDRAVIAQNEVPLSVWMKVSGEGEVCSQAERALAAVVRRLAVNPPLLDVPANSALRLDPCAVLDHATNLDAIGDPAKRTPATPHGCDVSGADWGMDFWLREWPRPDSEAEGHGTREVAGRTVYLEELPHRCLVIALPRPTRKNLAEVAMIDFYHQPGSPAEGMCDRAVRVMGSVLPKLPTS